MVCDLRESEGRLACGGSVWAFAKWGADADGEAEAGECEEALNVYAFSKLFFDNYARRYFGKTGSQLVGLRYFNVYGPQENHKGKMASMVF